MAIVVASSDTAEVFGLSDTIGTFYRGRLTELRPRAGWTEDAVVREVMHEEAPA
jgi:ABC-type sugar transport system ATPase subunit